MRSLGGQWLSCSNFSQFVSYDNTILALLILPQKIQQTRLLEVIDAGNSSILSKMDIQPDSSSIPSSQCLNVSMSLLCRLSCSHLFSLKSIVMASPGLSIRVPSGRLFFSKCYHITCQCPWITNHQIKHIISQGLPFRRPCLRSSSQATYRTSPQP